VTTETYFRFGGDRDLFGAFHAADEAAGADLAVVLCAPFAEEKKCSYRTFVQAARTFAAAGVPCLRFDYFGTGDSEGEFRDFSPLRAVRDIGAAAGRAREMAGVSRVALLGLRLGGALALAAARDSSADRVILWQPVLSGRSFFDLTTKRQMLRKQLIGGASAAGNRCSPVRTGEHLSDDDADDTLDLDGYPLSKAAGHEIRALDGAEAANAYPGPIRLLQISHTDKIGREYRELAGALGSRLTAAAVRCEPFWNRIDIADASPAIKQTLEWLK